MVGSASGGATGGLGKAKRRGDGGEYNSKKRRRGYDGGGGDGDGLPPVDPELLAAMGFGAFG